jgi:hypothetical protein
MRLLRRLSIIKTKIGRKIKIGIVIEIEIGKEIGNIELNYNFKRSYTKENRVWQDILQNKTVKLIENNISIVLLNKQSLHFKLSHLNRKLAVILEVCLIDI